MATSDTQSIADGAEVTGGVGPVPCPACGGTGDFELPDGRTEPCSGWDCNGTGKVTGYAVEVDGERHESTEGFRDG